MCKNFWNVYMFAAAFEKQPCRNVAKIRGSHQDAFFNIAVQFLRWNSMKNTSDGVQFFSKFACNALQFSTLPGKKLHFIIALINAEQ